MRSIGVTVVREPRRLHYPLDLVLKSFEPLDDFRVVGDEQDPESGELRTRFGSRFIQSPAWRVPPGGGAGDRALTWAAAEAARDAGASHLLFLQADEPMRPEHVAELKAAAYPSAWLTRLQLWRHPRLLRLDWTCVLPRWAALDLILPPGNEGDGSHLHLRPSSSMQQCPQWPMWHLSRIGSSKMIMERRKGVMWSFARPEQCTFPERYDYVPRRYENWMGEMPPEVKGQFADVLTAEVPEAIFDWHRDDISVGGGA